MWANSSQDRVRLWKLGIAGECRRCLEVKPLTNEKIDYQTDKMLANGILKLQMKRKSSCVNARGTPSAV